MVNCISHQIKRGPLATLKMNLHLQEGFTFTNKPKKFLGSSVQSVVFMVGVRNDDMANDEREGELWDLPRERGD